MDLTSQNQPQEGHDPSALSIRDAVGKMFANSPLAAFHEPEPTPQGAFENFFFAPSAQPPLPTVDVQETSDELHITANVVGYDPQSLWVNIDHGILTIKGMTRQGNAMSTFTQQLSIPEETTKEDVECEIEDGKLLITILKS